MSVDYIYIFAHYNNDLSKNNNKEVKSLQLQCIEKKKEIIEIWHLDLKPMCRKVIDADPIYTEWIFISHLNLDNVKSVKVKSIFRWATLIRMFLHILMLIVYDLPDQNVSCR